MHKRKSSLLYGALGKINMLLDMPWLCALHIPVLINKACTITIIKSFATHLPGRQVLTSLTGRRAVVQRVALGVRWHTVGRGAKHWQLRGRTFCSTKKVETSELLMRFSC